MNIKSFGGIFVHPESHIKVAPYNDECRFSEDKEDDRINLLKGLIFICDHGRKTNIRRHIASLRFPDGSSEKCILDIIIDGEKYNRSIGKSELLAKNNDGTDFYCDSSIIFSVGKYRYMPPVEFIAAVADEVDRISRNQRE